MKAGHCYEFSSAPSASSALQKSSGLHPPGVPQQSHLGTSLQGSVGVSTPLCVYTLDICAYICTLCKQEQIHKGRNIHRLLQHLADDTYAVQGSRASLFELRHCIYQGWWAGKLVCLSSDRKEAYLYLFLGCSRHILQFLSLAF